MLGFTCENFCSSPLPISAVASWGSSTPTVVAAQSQVPNFAAERSSGEPRPAPAAYHWAVVPPGGFPTAHVIGWFNLIHVFFWIWNWFGFAEIPSIMRLLLNSYVFNKNKQLCACVRRSALDLIPSDSILSDSPDLCLWHIEGYR